MVTVSSRLGSITGREQNGVNVFLGLPFAAPPTGALRWQPPQPARAWDGTLDATTHGNRCLQPPYPPMLDLGDIPGQLNEDCLYLNVYTPANDRGQRPVMVWIHGGAYIQGSANEYDGSTIARDNDIVVVAINYRLGAFGFLGLGQAGERYRGSAMLGIQDQIAALTWVQDNIADYGGDAGNVTIAGESAGAGSVFALIGAPDADGLFHKAIAFSPADPGPMGPDPLPALAERLGASGDKLIDALIAMPAEDLFALQLEGVVNPGACLDGAVVTQTPAAAYASGRGVPLIAGCNKDEGTYLAPVVAEMPGGAEAFTALFASQIGEGDAARYFRYLDQIAPDASPMKRLEQTWYDYFRAPVLRAAQAASAAGIGGWVYNFDIPTDNQWGTTHASDIPFTFNTFKDDIAGWSFHDGSDAGIRQLADQWSATVAAFMRTGDPNGAGLTDWPRYDRGTRRCLQLTRSSRVIDNPDAAALGAYGAG